MKVQFKAGPKIIVEFEGSTDRSIFEELARIQDIFGQDKCGKCGKSQLKFVVRTDDKKHQYYSLDCLDCRARLSYGCHIEGEGLFVKRKDKEDKWIKDNGWQKWNSETQSLE